MLELKGVSQGYDNHMDILKDLNLAIPDGQFVSIVGPSGAGKTTLLRLFNGMVRPSCGEVRVGGVRFDCLRGRARRQLQQRMAMIFQDFCLVEESSCRQNVLNGMLARLPFWRVLLGRFPQAACEQADAALAQVGLAGKEETPVRSLSGGQKQRVAIARALLQDAAVILADEPVASLDPATARQVLELLRQLQRHRGLTVVMNSHNVGLAQDFSDRIIGLRGGAVVADAPVGDWHDADFERLYAQEGR